MAQERKGMLLVLSGPAGVGKDTLGDRLIAEDTSFVRSVTVTTRAPRAGEVEGKNYFFISDEEYDRLIAEDAFVEHADVHNHRYGSLKSQVLAPREQGKNVLMVIDVQGARKVMEQYPDCVTVFILPTSFEELRVRLVGRGTETAEDAERRMRNARREIAEQPNYRYTIVNESGQLERCYQDFRAIVEAEKHRTERFSPTVAEK